jgi:hypothetical protein
MKGCATMWIRLALGFAMVGVLASTSEAAAIIYDFRAIPTGTTGATVDGPKAVTVTAPTGVVKLQLWGMITNTDGNNATEGFRATHMSLTSPGSLRGNYSPGALVAPFNGLGATPGVAADLDADGDMDLGDLRETGGDITKYFVPNAGAAALFWADVPAGGKAAETRGGTNYSSFLLGTFDYSFTGGDVLGATTQLTVRPRTKLDGLASSRLVNDYNHDGQRYSLNGNDPNIVAGPPVAVTVIPEPSTIALVSVGLLGLALAARRRRVS